MFECFEMEKAGRRRATSSNQAIQAVEQMFICLPGQVDLTKCWTLSPVYPINISLLKERYFSSKFEGFNLKYFEILQKNVIYLA